MKPLKQTTLCFLIKEDQVLLAMKKRGFGKGRWNGVGGKVNKGEELESAAIRETQEEINVTPQDLTKRALLDFYFVDNPKLNQQVVVYITSKWFGEPKETEEMKPKWFEKDSLPFDVMWADDKHWLPQVLKGSHIKADFLFGENDTLLDFDVREVYHPTVSKIIAVLEKNNCWYETFEHEATRTCEDVATKREGYTIHQGAKALIVRVTLTSTDKRFMMLVIPASMRLNSKKVKTELKAKDLRFATEAEVHQLTDGVQLGGIPALGNLFGLEVIVDPHLLENEKIAFNAGDRCFSIGMKSEDYRKIVNPRVEYIVT